MNKNFLIFYSRIETTSSPNFLTAQDAVIKSDADLNQIWKKYLLAELFIYQFSLHFKKSLKMMPMLPK